LSDTHRSLNNDLKENNEFFDISNNINLCGKTTNQNQEKYLVNNDTPEP
jgi:hypothetical protein